MNLTPYIKCSAALRHLTLVCTFSPIVAIVAAANAFHALNYGPLVPIPLLSLLLAMPYAMVMHMYVMLTVLTRRSCNWVLVLSGIGIAHTLLLVVFVLISVRREAGNLHAAIFAATWLFSLVFIFLVVFCVFRVMQSKRGVNIVPGVDFSDMRRRIKQYSTVPSKVLYQHLFSIIPLFSFSVALMCSTFFAVEDPLSLRARFGMTSTLASFAFGTLVCIIVFVGIRVGSDRLFRRLAPPPRELLKDKSINPVVLVRAFGDDTLRIKWGGFISTLVGPKMAFEQLIPSVTQFVGPFVAIGHPRESELKIHLPGRARRDFAKDTDWQSLIDEWFLRAAMIVTVWGPSVAAQVTPGLSWELSQIRDRQLLHRLAILCVPRAEGSSQSSWDELWNSLVVPGTASLSSSISPSGMLGVCFESGGSPLVIFSDLVAQNNRYLDQCLYMLTLAIMTLTVIGRHDDLWNTHA